jgi:hypothetical protein
LSFRGYHTSSRVARFVRQERLRLLAAETGKAEAVARAIATVDVDENPELARLADELAASGEPIVLRRGGEDVAVLLPANQAIRDAPSRPLSDAEREAFLATAGGWQGLIDVDAFLDANRESRRLSCRPRVSLE